MHACFHGTYLMHNEFMLAALQQARLGRGACAPNPSVGAVAVRHGKIIAQAYHFGAGTLHAEQLLLAKLPPNLSEVIVYVTLEPCNHWGKTPPCVDALVHYGVCQVVYAYSDPNPVVAVNNTPKLLEHHGIEVLHWPLEEVNCFYRSYRHWILTGMPWVTVKTAQTLDGKIAGSQGERVHLSNALCAEFTHTKRLETDVLLTTARTVNQDNPLFNVRLDGKTVAKPIAIVEGSQVLNESLQVFKTAKSCHIYYDEARCQSRRVLPNVYYHKVNALEGKLDLVAILRHLGALGFHDVWVEAGARLFSALHQANLVHQTYIYLVPTLLGPDATTAYLEDTSFSRAKKVSWQPMEDNLIVSLEWESEGALCLPG